MATDYCPRCGGVMEYEDDIDAESPAEVGVWRCQKCGHIMTDMEMSDDDPTYDEDFLDV